MSSKKNAPGVAVGGLTDSCRLEQIILEGPRAIELRALEAEDHLLVDLVLDSIDGWSTSVAALVCEARRGGRS